jgi:hypothetical protein
MAISVTVANDPLAVTHHRVIASGRQIFTPTTGLAISSIHNGGIIVIATDALTITLPQVATLDPGFMLTVVHHMAAGGALITIQSNASDAIWGCIYAVTGANTCTLFTSNGTANNNIKLTKATAKVDDWVTIVSNGLTDWLIVGGQGTWTN